MEQKYFDHSPRLEEVAQFTFEMLGDFWNDVGLTADLRINKYKENDSTTDFSKYNLHDPEQDIAKGFAAFKEKVELYNANSMELIPLMEFPKCLLDGITRLTQTYSEPREVNFERVAKLYINYQIVYLNKKIFSHNSFQEIQDMATESYDTIIKEKPDLNFEHIDENSTWKKISCFLDEMKNCKWVAEETKDIVAVKIIRHYVFNHFLRALHNVFEVDVAEMKDYYKKADFNKIIAEIEWLQMKQKCEGVHPDVSIWYWILPKSGTEETTDDFNQFISNEAPLTEYFVCSNDRLDLERAYQLLRHLRNNFPNNPQADFFSQWFQARTEIFSLKFDGSDGDAEKIKKALELYRATFQQFRYIAGKNLQEFLFDALAVETYFNPKQKKNILSNSQDNSGEGSLAKQAKTYWEFAYAVGLLEYNSKKTYGCTYNVTKNFWWAFPVHKFIHTEKAKERFSEEIQDEELNLPNLIHNYSDKKKLDNLLSKERKDLRQKIGERYYSNLSIAIMKAQTPLDFDNISNYITAMDAEKLAVNDECGATPLIRALYEYKCCQLYFLPEYRRKRGELLFYWNNEQEELNSHLATDFTGSKVCAEKRDDISSEYFQKLTEVGKEYGQNFTTEQMQSLEARKKALKEKVIIPLIEKIPPESLWDEALKLDASSCVSALQLAIDSWDADLVELIVNRIPQNPANYYISDEYTTPLQYAIRRYALFRLCFEICIAKGENIRRLSPVPKRKITAGGIFDKEQSSANLQNDVPRVLSMVPTETLGFDPNIKFKGENFTKIIHLLADRTKPISVDSFYYLIDQMDSQDQVPYNDALAYAKYLLETGNADLTTTDKEWTRKTNPFPDTTVLGYCIDKHNYPMLQLFLESHYSEQLKKIINLRLLFTDKKTKRQRYQTDPLMFVQNMILNIEMYYLKDPEKYHNYGKWIADQLNLFLTLFHKAGADFDLPDQDGNSIRDYLRGWKDKFPQGAIPEFLGI